MRKKLSTYVFLAIFALAAFPLMSEGATDPKPDLKVTELTAERHQTLDVPLRIEVALRIHNSGSSTGASSFVTRLDYRRKTSDPWQTLYDWTAGSTASGGGAVYSRTFDFNDGGTYYFKAIVDANNNIAESSEGNNTKSLTKSFEAGTPDLTVNNLAASEVSTTSSGSMIVKVQWDVENIGDGKAKGSFVSVLSVSKNSGGWNEVQRYTNSNLEKTKSLHFSKTITYTDFHSLRFKVETDDTHKIAERSEGNNSAVSNTITR